jgi:hypothetical protein
MSYGFKFYWQPIKFLQHSLCVANQDSTMGGSGSRCSIAGEKREKLSAAI